MTVAEIYKTTKEELLGAGVPEPEENTRLLLEAFFGIKRIDILTEPEKLLDESRVPDFRAAVERRKKREPVQHILGRTCFMGLDFKITPDALIPRPDTEILVEEVLRNLSDGSRILDLCTGSGCILTSLLKFSNYCEGVGVDISEKALALARENAESILGRRDTPESDNEGMAGEGAAIEFLQGDLFEPVRKGDRFDIIVSNPPYIKSDVIGTLEPEVRDHEPRIALDGLNNGLYFYNKIIPEAASFLAPGGMLFFEIGYDQGEEVSGLMKNEGYVDVNIVKDYSGLDRVVYGTKSVLM